MSKYYTTKYMETETIFRCVTGDIFRFYEAFYCASTGILFDIVCIDLTLKKLFGRLNPLSYLDRQQDALKGGDTQRGFPML